MSLLQELLSLHEAPEVPIELKDLIKAFPNHHSKAISKLWGGKRLVWHGDRFFDGHDLGPAYLKSIAAAHYEMKNGDPIEVNLPFQVKASEDDEDGGHDITEVDFTFHAEIEPRDTQECYLGYDPKKDKLYIGFDVWLDENGLNEQFDKAFEDETGEQHDLDNEDHQATYQEVWDAFKKHTMYGMVFEISHDGDEYTAEEAVAPMQGGFYRGTRKIFQHQHPNVIDIRLD